MLVVELEKKENKFDNKLNSRVGRVFPLSVLDTNVKEEQELVANAN